MKKLIFLFVLRLCLAKVRIDFQLLIANAQFEVPSEQRMPSKNDVLFSIKRRVVFHKTT